MLHAQGPVEWGKALDEYRLLRSRFMSGAYPRTQLSAAGVGYVGFTNAVCTAEPGRKITAIDADRYKITKAARGEVSFFEPGTERLLCKNLDTGKLRFITAYAEVSGFGRV